MTKKTTVETVNDPEWQATAGEAEVSEWKAATWDEKPKWMTEREADNGENDSDENQSELLNLSRHQHAGNKEAEKKQKLPFQC